MPKVDQFREYEITVITRERPFDPGDPHWDTLDFIKKRSRRAMSDDAWWTVRSIRVRRVKEEAG